MADSSVQRSLVASHQHGMYNTKTLKSV